jgi:hypothetical protein
LNFDLVSNFSVCQPVGQATLSGAGHADKAELSLGGARDIRISNLFYQTIIRKYPTESGFFSKHVLEKI